MMAIPSFGNLASGSFHPDDRHHGGQYRLRLGSEAGTGTIRWKHVCVPGRLDGDITQWLARNRV